MYISEVGLHFQKVLVRLFFTSFISNGGVRARPPKYAPCLAFKACFFFSFMEVVNFQSFAFP